MSLFSISNLFYFHIFIFFSFPLFFSSFLFPSHFPSLPSSDDVKCYNSAESAFTLSLTRDEAQHLTEFGITLEEAQDNVIDEAMIEVEEEMIRDSSNVEVGFFF